MFRLAFVTALIACTGDPAPAPGTATATATASASPSAPTPAPAPTVRPTPALPRLAPREIAIDRVETHRVQVARAEDGTGRRVAPGSGGAVAIDLYIDKLPARAMDPVLEIDGVEFRRYQILPGGTLRYVVADAALAEAGEVNLRWGRDLTAVADRLTVAP